MNIFLLDKDPSQAARYLCDKHVVKMFSESHQMLRTVVNLMLAEPVFFSQKHPDRPIAGWVKHPCTQWLLESRANFMWLYKHMCAIHAQYQLRYNKIHAEYHYINDIALCFPELAKQNLDWANGFSPKKPLEEQLTPVPLAMPDWVPGKTAIDEDGSLEALLTYEYEYTRHPGNKLIFAKVPVADAVKAYRNYYIHCKAKFATWAHSMPPHWWPGYQLDGFMFPAGRLFCLITQRSRHILDQAELMLELEDEDTSIGLPPLHMSQLYSGRRKSSSAPSQYAPEVETVRASIKARLKGKVPSRSVIQTWLENATEAESLEQRADRHIAYWSTKGYAK